MHTVCLFRRTTAPLFGELPSIRRAKNTARRVWFVLTVWNSLSHPDRSPRHNAEMNWTLLVCRQGFRRRRPLYTHRTRSVAVGSIDRLLYLSVEFCSVGGTVFV